MTRCLTDLAARGTVAYYEEWLRDLQEELNEEAAKFWSARGAGDAAAMSRAAGQIRIICLEIPFTLADLEAAKA